MSDRNVTRMHHVPRLLLNHFTDAQGSLHVYHLGERRWFKANPNHFGIKKSMYPQHVDEWLEHKVESAAGVVFKKVRNADTNLSEDERFIISRFISWQVFRTTLARMRLSNTDENQHAMMFQDEKSYLETAEYRFERPLTPEEREEVKRLSLLARTDPCKFVPEDGFAFLLENKMVMDKNLTPTGNQDVFFFMRLAWRIILAEKESFILSDNPVIITPLRGLGMDSPDFECVMPISKKSAIHIGRNRNMRGQDVEVVRSDKAVKRINARTLGNAYQYVISPRQDSWIKKNSNRGVAPTYSILRFSPEIIDVDEVQFGRLRCQNCGTNFTSAQWDSWEGKDKPMRGYKGVPPHECQPEPT